jgi:adenylylsulfate kinase
MKHDTEHLLTTGSRQDRETRNGHRAASFWLTGLSCAGKSTIAHNVERLLLGLGMQVQVFDGDRLRRGICSDLDFSPQGRSENIRRIGEVNRLFMENGTICLCALIAPLAADRARLRDILGPDYHEIYVKCPLGVCEKRDVKGYYQLARQGKIHNYTAISSPYDVPASPDLILETELETVEESTQAVLDYVLSRVAPDQNAAPARLRALSGGVSPFSK